ncbi:protein BREVIS RADIX-like isoform X2 [Dioscorea cayenensis subsp. rotundata]|uniref:Protein BREVIS RADIX-like isoform X2 n=1 Tax=Dioscorea cayennensis subsp. rotundata TaxID=55577 RepID=A0AB40B6V7_DIOCR|nr:protein BREVIS RADIX-like isoform X2 [Dioscorea cayenensis subsp. rotundata]
MLACIACSKRPDDGGDDSTARAATPRTKDAVKSLTSQIKDMVLKISGGNRQCKASSSSSSYRSKSVHHRSPTYLNDDTSDAEQCTYLRSTSANSMAKWDFTNINRNTERKWIPGIGYPPEEEQDVFVEDNAEPKEWMTQVEPGVQITLVSLPGGAGNDLKRIRFSRELFNKWQAQRWWGENFDRIMELYNVQRFSRQALATPTRSEDDEQQDSSYQYHSRVLSTSRESPITPIRGKDRCTSTSTSGGRQTTMYPGGYFPTVPDPTEHMLQQHFHPFAAINISGGGALAVAGVSGVRREAASSMDASRTTTSSRDEASISISNASDLEVTEWVEQDEPGVYITIRELADGTRELRRVRFSREKFGEVRAKLWWEENRERIQAQYL